MAIMIPEFCCEKTESTAEKTIFRKLEELLSDEWTVFHSFDINKPKGKNKLIDGEIDFLLFHPANGLLVMEVKGGAIKYDKGLWYQNQELREDFIKQAKSNKFAIQELLIRKLFDKSQDSSKKQLPFPVNHIFCFPDCFQRVKHLPVGLENSIIYGSDLNYIGEHVIERLKSTEWQFIPLDKHQEKIILSILKPVFDNGGSLFDYICKEDREITMFSEMQNALMMQLLRARRALIRGCAGSGKTLMAIRKAIQLANNGKSVLLLCFNKMLCEYLQKETLKCAGNNLIVSTYHDFCINELKKAELSINGDPKSEKYWNEDIPNAFANLVMAKPILFDSLIVDEGQDFNDEFWISISYLVKEDGEYYVFYDPDQNVFSRQLSFPDFENVYFLSQNCRSTKNIFEKVKYYASDEITHYSLLPEGIKPDEYQSSSSGLRLGYLSKILHKLVDEEHVPETEIAILGGHNIKKTCLFNKSIVGRFKIQENGISGQNIIPYYTYMKFKGCERSVIILLDVDETDTRWNNVALYTAMTRAKHLLYIIKK